jgi:hypothetical protein
MIDYDVVCLSRDALVAARILLQYAILSHRLVFKHLSAPGVTRAGRD